jgi:hypothetical protein
MSESRALVPMTTGGRVAALVPRSFAECWEQSKVLAASALVPTHFRGKPEDCCVAIMHGLEVGLLPNQALASIAVINGRPSLWGDGMLAVVIGSGLVESFNETDDGETAVCTIKRAGWPQPIVRQFSNEAAKKAGLMGKQGPWTQYPQRMRQMRARSWALRDGFADVLKGMHNAEEAEDIAEPRDITPPPVPDIPDEPAPRKAVAKDPAPPPIPELPPHDPHTGELLDARTDEKFIAALDDQFVACLDDASVLEAAEANAAEVERRGIQQAAADLADKHRRRIAKAKAQAEAAASKKPTGAQKAAAFEPPKDADHQETWVRIIKGMREIERDGGTLDALAAYWKSAGPHIQKLPTNWQTELTNEKDRIKAKLAAPVGRAA